MRLLQELDKALGKLLDPRVRARVLADLQPTIKNLTDPALRKRVVTDPKLGVPVIGGIAVVLLGLGFLGGMQVGHSAPSASIQPSASATALPTISAPIELSGPGLGKTAPFHLSGNVKVEYNVVSACSYYGNIKRVDGAAYVDGIDVVSATQPKQGAAQLRNVPAGEYYLEMITGAPKGCVWYVTFRASA